MTTGLKNFHPGLSLTVSFSKNRPSLVKSSTLVSCACFSFNFIAAPQSCNAWTTSHADGLMGIGKVGYKFVKYMKAPMMDRKECCLSYCSFCESTSHLSLNFVSSWYVWFFKNCVFSLIVSSSSPWSTANRRSPGQDNGRSMTERERDISSLLRSGLQTMPDPEVASSRQRLDGSCFDPGALDRPGTTTPNDGCRV